jgi:DICT domain-containing protein
MPSSYGVYLKNTLVALCHALEDHILNSAQEEVSPLVLVTFQQGKWYVQEADRYYDMAQRCSHVLIAALPDSGFTSHPTGQLPNVSLIHLLPEDPLVWEWNLIIVDRSYCAMVLCHELSPEDYLTQGEPRWDIERKFYGLWTFDRDQVEAAAETLLKRIFHYNQELSTHLQRRLFEIHQTKYNHQQDLTDVVSRIVTYLQTSQEQLVAVQRQTREFWELESQALRLSRNLNANKLQAFLRMAQRVDSQDPNNPVASLQVAALSETLGQLLDLATLRLRRLRLAGLFFRIGLAQAPTDIFAHPERYQDPRTQVLCPEQLLIGAQLLRAIPELDPVADIIHQHLEHWDGSGRPAGLRQEEIAVEARILGLVACFQALTQPQGDRAAYALGEALEMCRQWSGTRFDPMLVDQLASVIRLTEMGLMRLPDRPRHLPPLWLEESRGSDQSDPI